MIVQLAACDKVVMHDRVATDSKIAPDPQARREFGLS
jgi:hypothetical protein